MTYLALVRQLDKPEYKIEVLVRTPAPNCETEDDASHKGKDKQKKEQRKSDDMDGKRKKNTSGEAAAQQKLTTSVLRVCNLPSIQKTLLEQVISS